MSAQEETTTITDSNKLTVTDSTNPSNSSPSKNRRRRRKNHKKKNKGTNEQDTKQCTSTSPTKPSKPATRLPLNTHTKPSKKNKPWKPVASSSSFSAIMHEQKHRQQPNYGYTQFELDEQELLEQQMILEAIAASTKSLQPSHTDTNGAQQQSQQEDNEHTEQHAIAQNNESKEEPPTDKTQQIMNDALVAASLNAACDTNTQDEQENVDKQQQTKTRNTVSDEMLAIHLQQQERKELQRRQKLSQMYDGKYAKVTSSSAHLSAIPKSALQFYYDDESMLNGGMTKEEYQSKLEQLQQSEEQTVAEKDDSPPSSKRNGASKHDAKVWSGKHMHRLNEYEATGDLDMEMNIGNQAYNSFRNQLDKKGYISYHNYALEPSQRKR